MNKYKKALMALARLAFMELDDGQYDYFDTVCLNYVTRAPQSWCYVEEI